MEEIDIFKKFESLIKHEEGSEEFFFDMTFCFKESTYLCISKDIKYFCTEMDNWDISHIKSDMIKDSENISFKSEDGVILFISEDARKILVEILIEHESKTPETSQTSI